MQVFGAAVQAVVGGQAELHVEVGAVEGGGPGVGGEQAGGARGGGRQEALLLVLIIPVETLQVHLQAVVQEAVARTDRIGGQLLGLEHVQRRRHAGEEATGLVAGGDRGEEHVLAGQIIFGAGLPAGVVEAGLAEVAGHARARQGRGGLAVLVLVVLGVAQPADQAEGVGDADGGLAKGGVGLGAQSGIHHALLERRGVQVVVLGLVLVEVIQAGDPFDDVGLVRQAQLIALLVARLGGVEVEARRIGQVGRLGVAIGRDEGQRRGTEVVVQLGADGPHLQVLPAVRIDPRAAERRRGRLRQRRGRARPRVARRGAGQGALDHARPLAAQVGVFAGGEHRQLVGRLPKAGQAEGLALLIVVAVRQIAVAVGDLGGGAEGQGVVDRQVHRPGEAVEVVVADIDAGVAAELVAGALGDQVDGPAGGVTAVERALRTLQHFHPVQVVEDRPDAGRARDVDPVDVEGDGALGVGVGGEAAHAAHEGVHAGARLADRQARHDVLQVGGLGHARLLQRLGADHRDGQGGFLHRLLAAGGGDDHLLHGRPAIGGGRRGLGLGEPGRTEQQSKGGCAQKSGTHGNFLIPGAESELQDR